MLATALLLLSFRTIAQTYPFARLIGSPVMDTRGWNLTGDARIGDTGGDTDGLNNELVLCNPFQFNSGGCFYNQPVNISACQKWVAEFDYRIFDGSAADGIAFCFLANPPTGFQTGGNVGIPARPKGLMVILDTWQNCPGSTNVPKLEIRYADGITGYGTGTESILECPSPAQPTSGMLPILRQPTYNRLKISYDSGDIKVYVNNTLQLTGFYKINFSGYFGFTASTGGSTDRHSIRDFTLYTFKPIVSPPNGGPDKIVCSGDSVEIGIPSASNDPYLYYWNPTTGMSNPNIPNPKVRLYNSSAEPVTYTYFITKDSLTNDTLCAYSDAVQVTVLGNAAQAGADFTVCSGQKQKVEGLTQNGYRYTWLPTTGLSNATIANPDLLRFNTTDSAVVYQYVISATPMSNQGCVTYDTLLVTVLPRTANAGPDVLLCTGGTSQLGTQPIASYQYTWFPATGLSNPGIANPTITLENTTHLPRTVEYIVRSSSATRNCADVDTVQVTVLPTLAKPMIIGSRSVCPNVKNVSYAIANPQADVAYQWTIQGGTIKSVQGTSKILVDWGVTNAQAQVAVIATNAANCFTSTSSLPISINTVLNTEKPFSPASKDTLCLGQAVGIEYEVVNTNGSIYNWGVSGNGTIKSGNGTNRIVVDWTSIGIGKVWVNEQSTTFSDKCFGTSDTLYIRINPMPDGALLIAGSEDVCELTTQAIYRLHSALDSQYQWTVSGGSIVSNQANEVLIDWQAAGAGKVTVRETNQFGCEGAPIELLVTIHPIPKPSIAPSDLVVCTKQSNGRLYRVNGLPNSHYVWSIVGGTISSKADSSAIFVDWNQTGQPIQLSVVETSDWQCASQALTFPLIYDATTISLKSVSVQVATEKNIDLRFQFLNPPALSNTFSISRRPFLPTLGSWTAIASVTERDSLYTDENLATDDVAYEYKIEGSTHCGDPLTSLPHHSIRLTGAGDTIKERTIELRWNSYDNWQKGVQHYEVWRKLDEEAEFSLYETLSERTSMTVRENGKEGFMHCYRIKAIEKEGFGSFSWSNEVCISFIHPIVIPNIITPNNDRLNDQWVIDNLSLYPQHELAIYNRFGKQVYYSTSYEQDWDGASLPTGVYYYYLKTTRNKQKFKGWVQILK